MSCMHGMMCSHNFIYLSIYAFIVGVPIQFNASFPQNAGISKICYLRVYTQFRVNTRLDVLTRRHDFLLVLLMNIYPGTL